MGISEILAILGISFTLFAPIIAISYKNYLDSKSFKLISKSRKKSLAGKWKGNYTQDNVIEKKDSVRIFSLKLEFKKSLVIGTGKIEHDSYNYPRDFEVRGGFKNDRFLILNYTNRDEAVVQFGCFILELKPTGRKLVGKFIGYGQSTEEILTGNMELLK